MPYPKQTWVDGSAGDTPIEAARLNHIENGIETAQATAEAASPTYANLPAGATLTVLKSGGTWPARPTARADVTVAWKGADPSPAIVSSGTGGMLDGVDYRLVTP